MEIPKFNKERWLNIVNNYGNYCLAVCSEHDNKCPIMCAIQTEDNIVSKVKAIDIFKKYYNKYN